MDVEFVKSYHALRRIAKLREARRASYTIGTRVLKKKFHSLADLWRHVSMMSPSTGSL